VRRVGREKLGSLGWFCFALLMCAGAWSAVVELFEYLVEYA
jgi:hypothetical protein